MWSKVPDHVILLGVRSWLSAAGIIFVLAGSWQVERFLIRAKKKQQLSPTDVEYAAMSDSFDPSNPQKPTTATTTSHPDGLATTPACMNESLMKGGGDKSMILAFCIRFLGWCLLGVSQLLTTRNWSGWNTEAWEIVSCVIFLLMGLAELMVPLGYQTVRIPHCILPRCLPTTDVRFPWATSLGWVLQAIALSLVRHPPPLGASFPFWCLSIAIAPVFFHHAANVAEHPVVFHMGGPLLVFGYYWFWMGTNVTVASPDSAYLPVYLTGSRTVWAYCGATLIFMLYWMTCYALDEMPVTSQRTSQAPGFGMHGFYFGAVWEIKLLLAPVWAIFAVSAFYPYLSNVVWPFFILFTMLAIGVVMGILYEHAVRQDPEAVGGSTAVPQSEPQADPSNPEKPDASTTTPPLTTNQSLSMLNKWSKVWMGLFCILVFEIWALIDWLAMLLATAGIVCFLVGQYLLYFDRKRGGYYWMTHAKLDNPTPMTYSYGTLLTPLGMLLLAWAMSLRYY